MTENYSFEIDIQFFYFNVLLVSDLFNPNSLIEKNSVAFKALKDIFMSLYQQVHLEQSQAARLLLQNLVRWINDDNGHFFDPELRTIYSLKLKEMFDEFLLEIAQLGGQVVFASPYKVIISTKKSSYYSAMNFINYLVKSLQKESKF